MYGIVSFYGWQQVDSRLPIYKQIGLNLYHFVVNFLSQSQWINFKKVPIISKT